MSSEIQRWSGDPPSPYEDRYGFSRGVAGGGWVMVGGTTSLDGYGVVHGETPYEQTRVVLEKIERELMRAGAELADVVQGRIYVVDISRADDVGRAWSESFSSVRPVMTMVEVSGLIDPRMLVEIEIVARCRT